MSDYLTIRNAIADRVEGLIGTTLPADTVLYRGLPMARFSSEQQVLAVNVALGELTAAPSELLGDALLQIDAWTWEVHVASQAATEQDDGDERAWKAIEAIRASLCPYDGWRPVANADVLMFVGVSPGGPTAAGAMVWVMRFTHSRNEG